MNNEVIENDKIIFDYIHSMIPYYDPVNFPKNINVQTEFDSDNLNDPRYKPYQERILRLISIYTPQIHQLLFYKPGSGKTRIYLALIENNRKYLGNTPIIVLRNTKLIDVLKNQIILYDKLSGYKLFQSEENLKKMTTTHINSIINKHYRILTYYKYARIIENDFATELKNSSNTILIMDEIQHCRDNEKIKIYTLINKMCHSIKNTQIVLCSGTPMIDSASEFINIFNLISNKNIQLQYDDKNILTNARELLNLIIGKVSYIRFKDDKIRINKAIPGLKNVIVNGRDSGIDFFPIKMSDFQSIAYHKAVLKDIDENSDNKIKINRKFKYDKKSNEKPDEKIEDIDEKLEELKLEDNDVDENEDIDIENTSSINKDQASKSNYSNSIQASLFVYPDGSYGMRGQLKYLRNSYKPKDDNDWLNIFKNIKLYPFINSVINKSNTHILYTNYRQKNEYIILIEKYLNKINKKYKIIKNNNINDFDELNELCSVYKVIIILGSSSELTGFIEEIKLKNEKESADFKIIVNIYNEPIKKINKFNEMFNYEKLGHDKFMDMVYTHSIKYHYILNYINENKLGKIFIYSKFIGGSGALVLNNLLEQIGYINAVYESEYNIKNDKRARFAFISSGTSDAVTKSIINIYNSPKNYMGEYIQIFIGTETISEGITLTDTPIMFSTTQNWNMSSIEQAESRIKRLNAFDYLQKKTNNNILDISIYRLSAIPISGDESIDSYMLEISKIKDFKIKQIERLCKIAALDCVFNKEQNTVIGNEFENTRECEYMKCDYKCANESYKPNSNILKYDTADTFYENDSFIPIFKEIKKLFKNNTIYSYDYVLYKVKQIIPTYIDRNRAINECLYKIINDRIYIRDNDTLILKYDKGMIYTSPYFADISVYNHSYTNYGLIPPNKSKITLKQYVSTNDIIPMIDLLKSDNIQKTKETFYTVIPTQYDINNILQFAVKMKENGESAAVIDYILSSYEGICNNKICGHYILFTESPYKIYINKEWIYINLIKDESQRKYVIDKLIVYYKESFEKILLNRKNKEIFFGLTTYNPAVINRTHMSELKFVNTPEKEHYEIFGQRLAINILEEDDIKDCIDNIEKYINVYMTPEKYIFDADLDGMRRKRDTIFNFKGYQYENLKSPIKEITGNKLYNKAITSADKYSYVLKFLKDNNLLIYY
jgi:hypothetical protein